MGNIFQPGNPLYSRRVHALNVYMTTVAGVCMVMMDHGKQDHVFTGLQRYVYKKIDRMYEVTPEELGLPAEDTSSPPAEDITSNVDTLGPPTSK